MNGLLDICRYIQRSAATIGCDDGATLRDKCRGVYQNSNPMLSPVAKSENAPKVRVVMDEMLKAK